MARCRARALCRCPLPLPSALASGSGVRVRRPSPTSGSGVRFRRPGPASGSGGSVGRLLSKRAHSTQFLVGGCRHVIRPSTIASLSLGGKKSFNGREIGAKPGVPYTQPNARRTPGSTPGRREHFHSASAHSLRPSPRLPGPSIYVYLPNIKKNNHENRFPARRMHRV